jgi:SAM-dependent methyltransferase
MPIDASPRAARRYWEAVASKWTESHRDELWRRCSDLVHVWWIEGVARDLPPGCLLKTDLFDEAFGDGLEPWFAERGHKVVACDLALATAVGASRKRASMPAAVADVRRLPFPASAFDTVFSDSTLDHFDSEHDLRRSLRELCRVLRPGGVLLLTMDNPGNPFVWLRNLRPAFWMRLGLVPYEVGVTCGAPRLTRLLDAAGFDVAAPRTILHAPRVLLVPVCRWLASRGSSQPGPRWRAWLGRFERLDRLPTRWLTGHFIAVVARKRP